MDDLSTLQLLVAMAVLVLGPAGGVWMGIKGSVVRIEQQLTNFTAQMRQDRDETREWLKGLQIQTSENTTDIAFMKGQRAEP